MSRKPTTQCPGGDCFCLDPLELKLHMKTCQVTRRCTQCNYNKPGGDFVVNYYKQSGYMNYKPKCKSCINQHKKWLYKNDLQYNFDKNKREALKNRGLTWTLTFNEFIAIKSDACYLCGGTEDIGIDRIKNYLGYEWMNCAACCSMCNYIKGSYELEVLLPHIRKMFRWDMKKNVKIQAMNKYLASLNLD